MVSNIAVTGLCKLNSLYTKALYIDAMWSLVTQYVIAGFYLFFFSTVEPCTVQLNLNLTTCAGTRLCLHIYHMQNFKNWHVHALLHVILACARGIANTREVHIMSSHLVCHTTRVVYSSSRQ